jgi:hypothetical protein
MQYYWTKPSKKSLAHGTFVRNGKETKDAY